MLVLMLIQTIALNITLLLVFMLVLKEVNSVLPSSVLAFAFACSYISKMLLYNYRVLDCDRDCLNLSRRSLVVSSAPSEVNFLGINFLETTKTIFDINITLLPIT